MRSCFEMGSCRFALVLIAQYFFLAYANLNFYLSENEVNKLLG